MLLRFPAFIPRFVLVLLVVLPAVAGLPAAARVAETEYSGAEALPCGNATGDDMQTLYFFSGLGADARAFDRLELPGCRIIHIRWIDPLKGESMADYARRLSEQITVPHPVLVGLSFGGMMAIEVSRIIPVQKLVLISSAKTAGELAANKSFFLKWGLYKYLPGSWITKPNFMVYRLFGAASPADKALLAAILEDTDPRFYRWAMNGMVHWDNSYIPAHLIHIHGTADRIIPFQNVKADFAIEGGGHLMVYNRAAEISRIIRDYLNL